MCNKSQICHLWISFLDCQREAGLLETSAQNMMAFITSISVWVFFSMLADRTAHSGFAYDKDVASFILVTASCPVSESRHETRMCYTCYTALSFYWCHSLSPWTQFFMSENPVLLTYRASQHHSLLPISGRQMQIRTVWWPGTVIDVGRGLGSLRYMTWKISPTDRISRDATNYQIAS